MTKRMEGRRALLGWTVRGKSQGPDAGRQLRQRWAGFLDVPVGERGEEEAAEGGSGGGLEKRG